MSEAHMKCSACDWHGPAAEAAPENGDIRLLPMFYATLEDLEAESPIIQALFCPECGTQVEFCEDDQSVIPFRRRT